MKSKHQLILVLLAIAVLILLPALANYLIDPYHMYGSKSRELINLKRNDQYQVAGLIRSYLAEEDLGFDCVIMGNSHGQNFSPAQIEEVLDTGRVLKLTMAGSWPKRQWIVMERALQEPGLKRVIWLIDGYYTSAVDSEAINQPLAFPADLYQSDLGINTYIFNADVFLQSLRDLGLFPMGNSPQGDDYGTWYAGDEWWDELVSQFHETIRDDDEYAYHQSSLESQSGNLPSSIEALYAEYPVQASPSIDRLASLAKANPDVKFDFLIGPYPAAHYIACDRAKLASLFAMRRYAVKVFDGLPNVQLHAFDTDEEIVTDLKRYKDVTHYDPDVNRYMIESIPGSMRVLNAQTIDDYENEWFSLLQRYQSHCIQNGPLSEFKAQDNFED